MSLPRSQPVFTIPAILFKQNNIGDRLKLLNFI